MPQALVMGLMLLHKGLTTGIYMPSYIHTYGVYIYVYNIYTYMSI